MQIILFLLICSALPAGGTFPQEQLPSYIEPLTPIGQRAEWSHDGQKIMFVTRAGGKVREIGLRTRKIRTISQIKVPDDWGFYRALYLSNGDYLFTSGPARDQAHLIIADSSLTSFKIFDLIIAEGPAVSRSQLRIAFTKKQDKIWLADIIYRNGEPFLSNEKLIIDNRDVVVDGIKYKGMVEPQNFRPPDDSELIWSQYGTDERGIFTSETMGYRFSDGKLVNYSRAPNQYDEPEGIFPDGLFTLTECDRHHNRGTAFIDIYCLKLDGTGETYHRLTYFSEVPGFRASNPVVSDDGKWIAFQESRSDSPPGAGDGLYLMDFELFKMDHPTLFK